MGARDLLVELRAEGFRLTAEGDRLVVRPASKLTPELREVVAAAKPELLALVLDPDGRVTCTDCTHARSGWCANHRRAGLWSPEVGPALATLPQRCPGFSSRTNPDEASR